MKRYTLDEDDKFMVLASDGVWEFLTNVEVMSMVAKHTDPLDAALEVWSAVHANRPSSAKERKSIKRDRKSTSKLISPKLHGPDGHLSLIHI